MIIECHTIQNSKQALNKLIQEIQPHPSMRVFPLMRHEQGITKQEVQNLGLAKQSKDYVSGGKE